MPGDCGLDAIADLLKTLASDKASGGVTQQRARHIAYPTDAVEAVLGGGSVRSSTGRTKFLDLGGGVAAAPLQMRLHGQLRHESSPVAATPLGTVPIGCSAETAGSW